MKLASRWHTPTALALLFVFVIFATVYALSWSKNKTSTSLGPPGNYDGNMVEVLRDEQHFVTCYVYRGNGISCVRDHGR